MTSWRCIKCSHTYILFGTYYCPSHVLLFLKHCNCIILSDVSVHLMWTRWVAFCECIQIILHLPKPTRKCRCLYILFIKLSFFPNIHVCKLIILKSPVLDIKAMKHRVYLAGTYHTYRFVQFRNVSQIRKSFSNKILKSNHAPLNTS